MKHIFKKFWLLFLAVTVASVGALIAFPSSSNFTDFWTILGNGTLRNTAIAYIDTNRDFNLYDGDVNLGVSGSRPSTTAGAYPGLAVPIYNASGSAWTEGDVIIASRTSTTSGYGSLTTVVATSSVLGVAAESIANGAVGLMRVDGYALVHTTGTVLIGDIVVSSATAGYAGKIVDPSSFTAYGVAIGKAMSVGTAAGGSTLVLLSAR